MNIKQIMYFHMLCFYKTPKQKKYDHIRPVTCAVWEADMLLVKILIKDSYF